MDSDDWFQIDIERVLDRFEQQRQQGGVDLKAFVALLPAEQQADSGLLDELVRIELEYNWREWRQQTNAPRPPLLETYAEQLPALQLSVDLICEEFELRWRWGDSPSREELPGRFPQFAVELRQPDAGIGRRIAAAATLQMDTQGVAAPSTRPGSIGEQPGDSDWPPAPQQLSIGRYHADRLIGFGAFGAVYAAFDPQLQREVAVKTPHPRIAARGDFSSILREARLAARLQHPNIVRVYDVVADDSTQYIVSELIRGRSLAQQLMAGSLELVEAAHMVATVATALHAAHEAGLVHRDIKPANILIDQQGQPFVVDFGLATPLDQQSPGVSGTPAYMAPEQIRGEEDVVDQRADIWSLGVVLYELLCGQRPFVGDVGDTFAAILREPPPPLHRNGAPVPPQLAGICQRCLAKDKTQRYATAAELAADLLDYGAGPPAGDAGTGAGNLPHLPGEFVGRQRELSEITTALRETARGRLVTLSGPGGMGKTRLSVEAARQLQASFPGGCWLVELANVDTAAGIANAVLEALQTPLTGEATPVEKVSQVLEYRPPLLLVLDNFEQVVQHAASTVAVWRKAAPHISMLATCRGPLGLADEREIEIAPLPIPDTAMETLDVEAIGSIESVQLFVQRAAEVRKGFTLTGDNASTLADICHRLEGVPLAIELAAARCKLLQPQQVLKKLDDRLNFLRSTRRDLPRRQQTMAGAIEWSFDLLDPVQRSVFLQAAYMPGGLSLVAAEAILLARDLTDAADGAGEETVLDTLQSLCEQCLIRVVDTPGGPRFQMYQTISEFGRQRLHAAFSSEQLEALDARASDYFVSYLEAWSSRLNTADDVEAIDRVIAEADNALAIYARAMQPAAGMAPDVETAARIALALDEPFGIRGRVEQRVERLEAVLAAPEEYRAKLLTALAHACQSCGQWDKASQSATNAVAAARQAGVAEDLSAALWRLGDILAARGELREARELFVEAQEHATTAGWQTGLVRSLTSQGVVAWREGDYPLALSYYEHARSLASASGNEAGLAQILRQQAHVLRVHGEFAQATARFEEAELFARRRGDWRLTHLALAGQATVLAEEGQYDAAIAKYQQAQAMSRRMGDLRGVAVNRGNEGLALADVGKHAEAIHCFTEAEAINGQLKNDAARAINLSNRAVSTAALGDLQAAVGLLDTAEPFHRESGNRQQLAIDMAERAGIALAQGDASHASQLMEQAIDEYRAMGVSHSVEYLHFLAVATQAAATTGDADTATHYATAALQLAADLGVDAHHPRERLVRDFVQVQQFLDAN